MPCSSPPRYSSFTRREPREWRALVPEEESRGHILCSAASGFSRGVQSLEMIRSGSFRSHAQSFARVQASCIRSWYLSSQLTTDFEEKSRCSACARSLSHSSRSRIMLFARGALAALLTMPIEPSSIGVRSRRRWGGNRLEAVTGRLVRKCSRSSSNLIACYAHAI